MKYQNYLIIGLSILCFIIIYEYIYELIRYNAGRDKKKFFIKTRFIAFMNYIFIEIPSNCYKYVIASFTILLIPFNILVIFAKNLSIYLLENKYIPRLTSVISKYWAFIKSKVKLIYDNIKKNLTAKNFLQEQLNIYYECISAYIQTNNLKVQSGFTGYFISLTIFLLQFGISFATTLAGANLIFGSVSGYAPFIFTFVIQGLIVVFSNKGFEKTKKSQMMRHGLWAVVTVSIFFSYTGIVIGQESPISRYKSAYEVYEQRFKDLRSTISLSIDDDSQENKLKSLFTDFDLYKKNIESVRNNLQDSINGVRITYFTVPQRNAVTGEIEYRFDQGLYDQAQRIASDTTDLKNEVAILDNYLSEFEKIPEKIDSKIEDYVKSIRENINNENSSTDNNQENNDNNQENNDNNQENNDDNQITTALINNLIKYANTFSAKYNSDGLDSLEENFIDNLMDSIRQSQNLKTIILNTTDNVFGKQDSSANNNDKNEFSFFHFIKNLWSVGIDQEMSQLASKRTTMREQAENSYEKISIYANEDQYKAKLDKLEKSKNDVLNEPNLFSYAIDIWTQNDSNKTDLVIMLTMAVIIDLGAAFLGFIKQKKSDSFIYVKTSKDYYDEYDDIFEMMFMSLMRNMEIKVKRGKFTEISMDDYKNNCMQYAAKTAEHIKGFLDKFEISEATYTIGFNLKCPFNQEELKDYKGLISILLKTNLLKIITYEQYLILENKNFRMDEENDTKYEGEDKKQYYLLLRNKGENYLRENIPFQYVLENSEEDGDHE